MAGADLLVGLSAINVDMGAVLRDRRVFGQRFQLAVLLELATPVLSLGGVSDSTSTMRVGFSKVSGWASSNRALPQTTTTSG